VNFKVLKFFEGAEMTCRFTQFLFGATAFFALAYSGIFAAQDESIQHKARLHEKKNLDQDILTTFSVRSGVRFHDLRQEGPSAITFNPDGNGNVTASNGVNNKYKFALSEFTAAAEVMFYGGFSFSAEGSYGALPGNINCKANVDWSRGQLPDRFNYDIVSRAYTYGYTLRVQRWFAPVSWFKCSVLGGWGYNYLSIFRDSKTRFSAPFGGMNFCFAFAKSFIARLQATYSFSGGRREQLRFSNVSQEDILAGFVPSRSFSTKSGSVSGPKVSLDLTHTFHSGWQIFAGADWKQLRTPHRIISVDYTSPPALDPLQNSTGVWNEKTVWSSIGAWVGLEHNF